LICRNTDGAKNGNNANHHHEFDKRKASLLVHCSLLEFAGATLANRREDGERQKTEWEGGFRDFYEITESDNVLLRGSKKLPDGGVNAVSGLQNKPV
jgi:hypothetical protein